MEKASKRLAENIGNALNYDDEKKAVLTYGFIGISQLLLILALTSVIGIIFGFFIESLIVFTSVGLLRRAIGGVHSGTYYSCIILTVSIISGISALGKYVFLKYIDFIPLISGIAIVYLIAIALTYKLVPVGNPRKPIRTEAKRKRLRKNAFSTLAVYILISGVLLFLTRDGSKLYLRSYCIVLALSVFTQIFLITKAGHFFIGLLDKMFARLSKICSGN